MHETSAVAENQQNRVVQTRYGPMLVNVGDSVIGRALITHGEFSPGEVQLFHSILEPGTVVVEAGANIGCFTLVFAQCVGPTGRVYAYEPQRLIFQMLCANLALNNVKCVEASNRGLGGHTAQMVVPALDYARGGNFGGLALAASGSGEPVSIDTIDNLNLAECALIKADVQGMERAVLEGARQTIARCRPFLYVENDVKARSRQLLEEIDAQGYRAYWHLPWVIDHRRPSSAGDEDLRKNVSVNLICLPDDVDLAMNGVRRVKNPDDWWTTE